MFHEALTETTRERAPLDWAGTMTNLGLTYAARFDKTGDPTDLDRAKDHYHAAREVFAKVGAPHSLDMIDRNLARLAAKRP